MKLLYKIRFYPLLLSIVSLFIGFYYSAIKAGIPYQDPTSEMLEKYMFYQRFGDRMMLIGIILLIISVIFLIVIKVIKNKKEIL